MGPGCLTAVFGMGTGVSTRVCSPEGFAMYQDGSGGSRGRVPGTARGAASVADAPGRGSMRSSVRLLVPAS